MGIVKSFAGGLLMTLVLVVLVPIVCNEYISFLVPLVLTAWMYSFVYANNFRDSLVDDVSERYNEWKGAGRTRP